MSKEFSGEQKLRIVLESIIRNVPKGEQSKKYGVTEQEFQSWHDHLIQNGGKIFDSSVRTSLDTRKPKRKMSPLVRIFLSISLLTNLGLIIFGLGEGLLIVSASGASPWSVLAQGLFLNIGFSVGLITIFILYSSVISNSEIIAKIKDCIILSHF